MNKSYQILISTCIIAILIPSCGRSEGNVEPSSNKGIIPPTLTTSLPLAQPDTFYQNLPIWAHASAPSPYEIVLFRHTFSLDERWQDIELFIFADTRYKVWLDGEWIGRGPARFSQVRREYDIYPLDPLQPGDHLIAILVQWAPNNRRSESSTPLLLSHIQGVTSKGPKTIARTGSRWKALLSSAWGQQAVPVHTQNLIGPTELLDLRQLARDWMMPDFSDDEWPTAVVKDISSKVIYQPRSIPLLANAPFTPTMIDAGSLSPGRAVGELAPPVSDPCTITFQALVSTNFTVETLTGTETSPSGIVFLDNEHDRLVWKEAGNYRPDVYMTSVIIEPGAHILSFANIPPQGLTFSISTQNIELDHFPFQQGIHAGRRLLLAEPVTRSDFVLASLEEGVTVEFTTTPAYVVLDLGRVVHGRLMAQVTGPEGAVVDIGWDERLLPGTLRPLPYPGSLHPQWNQTDSWILDGTTRSISTIDARAGRYVMIAAWGNSPILLDNIMVYEERYPLVQRGWFSSSNARLDAIWQVGVDSLYPNMTDAYTDTPWRERGQWWGDAYVQDHINRVAFGNTKLLKRGLLFMSDAFTEGRPPALAPNSGKTLLLDFGMLWVQSLYDYHQITEDLQFLTQVYPVLREFMAYLENYENSVTGLLDIPPGEWWETALIDWGTPDNRYGQSTAINALYYGTLLDASSVAEALEDSANALAWRQKADIIKQQVNKHLYLPTQHQYLASISQGKAISPTIHAQAWPLAYGVVPDQESNEVALSLLELPNAQIYGMFWVLDALGRSGRIPEALNIIETHYGTLLDSGATTWWEGFNSQSRYNASLSHGWGGASTWFLTTYILGARRTGPNTWLVKPSFSGVRYAAGSLPLEDDELEVYWERESCEDSKLELIAPIHTVGKVVVSRTSDTMTLTLNDHAIWQDGVPLMDGVIESADGIHISLQEGIYTLHLHENCRTTLGPTIRG